MRKILGNLLLIATAVVVSGCATSRGSLEITEEISVNPESGEAIKIVRVSDARQFQIDPPEPDIPSLKNNEINDPSVTSRAIARKRNSFGAAMGDILLPEGQSVMALVESSLTRGFRENGFRVVSEEDADFADATAIEVDIEKFWGWFQPGFWSLKLHFQTLLRVTGPLGPFANGAEFDSDVEKSFQIATANSWRETIDIGLEELNRDIAEDLAAYRDAIRE